MANVGRNKRRWRWVAGTLFLVLGVGAAPLLTEGARAERPSTDDVEAAYLYNFGKFVRWPETQMHGPVTICFTKRDSLAEAVSRLTAGEQVNGRSLDVQMGVQPDAAARCSILYIGSGDPSKVEEFLRASRGKPVLTVSDAPDFLARGGILQFLLMGDHVRFAASVDAAARNGLSLSSELLKVAISVRDSREGGVAR
jgi:hypothetical protein